MRMAPLVFLFGLLAGLHLPGAARPACADSMLRLNEFVAGPARDWDGSGAFSSRDDEWVEVVNVGASSLDLSGFLLTDGDQIPRFALGGTLDAGGHRVVFGRDSYDWERAHGFPAFGLSLGNTGDKVMLWQVTGAETLLVDSYVYVTHQAASDRAMGRLPDGGAWALFDGLNRYTGTLPPPGNGCMPTPVAVNACASTPARNATWGQVKSLYR